MLCNVPHATRSAQQVIMHCGSPDPAVKRWANYSAIALVVQVVLFSSFPFVRVQHALRARLQMIFVTAIIVAEVYFLNHL